MSSECTRVVKNACQIAIPLRDKQKMLFENNFWPFSSTFLAAMLQENPKVVRCHGRIKCAEIKWRLAGHGLFGAVSPHKGLKNDSKKTIETNWSCGNYAIFSILNSSCVIVFQGSFSDVLAWSTNSSLNSSKDKGLLLRKIIDGYPLLSMDLSRNFLQSFFQKVGDQWQRPRNVRSLSLKLEVIRT